LIESNLVLGSAQLGWWRCWLGQLSCRSRRVIDPACVGPVGPVAPVIARDPSSARGWWTRP